MTHDNDLIRRIDAMQATQVGPSDEWAKATKSGYNQAATDIAMNIMKLPAAPALVQVKPLVWHEGDEPDEWKSGEYDVWCELGKFQLYYWSIVKGEPHDTADAAKAAAQADYAARIMAALDVQPVPDDPSLAENIQHVLASATGPQHWFTAPDVARIRADALREAANVDWSHGTDVMDTAPEFLSPWQRGLVAGQRAMQAAILDLIDTPPPPDAMAERVAALVEAAEKVTERFLPVRADLIFSKRTAIDGLAEALAAMKGGQ